MFCITSSIIFAVSKSDLSVTFNGNNYTSFSVTTNASNDTVITFAQQMTYSADPGDTNTSSELGVFIKPGSKQTGVLTNPEYDYSQLGETWSDPRIFRILSQDRPKCFTKRRRRDKIC